MKVKEHKIGSKFFWRFNLLEASETKNATCSGCFFYYFPCDKLGPCGKSERSDGKNIIFRKVKLWRK